MSRRTFIKLASGIVPLLAFGWSGMGVASAQSAPPADQGGYLFVTFKGESTPVTEQIYFGLSTDGVHWEALNNADPVLLSDVGEKGVRDPYLLRSHDGKKFFIVATDLSINLNKNWTRATHAGSKSVVVWESNDLVKWSAPRLIKVAADDAGCTWAPEAIYDEQTSDYLVYWASTTQRDNFAKQRICAAHTTNFKTFSSPEIYIDQADAVYDADIVRDGNRYYRFFKDSIKKAIMMEVADQLAGPWREIPSLSLAVTTQRYEGPAAFPLMPRGQGQPKTWCLLLDNGGYNAFTTTDLASGNFTASNETKFPFAFRHGSVLPQSAEEYQRVKSAYASVGTPK
jgi:sucrose-6-phosphate hydrolase SacC (GH32 family)